MLRRFLAVLTLVFAATCALAEMRESRVNLLTDAFLKEYQDLSRPLNLPQLPTSKEVVVMERLSTSRAALMIVGPPSADAETYAEALKAWCESEGRPYRISYRNEDKGVVALVSVFQPQLGAFESHNTLDQASLVKVLRTLGRSVCVVVSAYKTIRVEGLPAPNFNYRSNRYWLENQVAGIPTLRWGGVVSHWELVGFVLWVAAIPVGFLTLGLSGLYVVKTPRLDVGTKRRIFAKLLRFGFTGVIAVHASLTVATLPYHLLDNLSMLWWGKQFATLMLPVLPLVIAAPGLFILPMQGFERKIFGPTPEEALAQDPKLVALPSKPATKPSKLLFTLFVATFFALMIGVFNGNSYVTLAALAVFLVLMVAIRIGARKKGPQGSEENRAKFAALLERVNHLAGTNIKGELLTVAIVKLGAFAVKDKIMVTELAVEHLEEPELEFLALHEIGHIKLGHVRRRRRLALLSMLPMFLWIGYFTWRTWTHTAVNPALLTPVMLFVFVGIFSRSFGSKKAREEELEADAFATRLTGNPAAAESALRKITLNSTLPGIHAVDMKTHPAVDARIDAIRRLIAQPPIA